jgi:hypothetical protein
MLILRVAIGQLDAAAFELSHRAHRLASQPRTCMRSRICDFSIIVASLSRDFAASRGAAQASFGALLHLRVVGFD